MGFLDWVKPPPPAEFQVPALQIQWAALTGCGSNGDAAAVRYGKSVSVLTGALSEAKCSAILLVFAAAESTVHWTALLSSSDRVHFDR